MHPETLTKARTLRKNQTPAELKLWQLLRRRNLGNLKFRKQAPIGPYIVDFLCCQTKLIVEIDGSQHNETQAITYDHQRTQWLEHQGYKILRFWNNEVLKHPNTVAEKIWQTCQPPSASGTFPLQGKETNPI